MALWVPLPVGILNIDFEFDRSCFNVGVYIVFRGGSKSRFALQAEADAVAVKNSLYQMATAANVALAGLGSRSHDAAFLGP